MAKSIKVLDWKQNQLLVSIGISSLGIGYGAKNLEFVQNLKSCNFKIPTILHILVTYKPQSVI